MPDIAYKEQHDAISAKGFSLGYIGSVLLLILNLAMVMSVDSKPEALQMMRYSFVMVNCIGKYQDDSIIKSYVKIKFISPDLLN